MAGQIPKQVLQNLKQIVAETGKEIVGEAGKVTESIITGKELLGDIVDLSPEQLAQKRAEDEQGKQKEISDVRSQVSGRQVEKEMEEIRKEKKKKEEEEERIFLEKIRRQREAEAQERAMMAAEIGVSTNPAKQKKSRGSAMAHGKKKSSMPDPSQMSQTSEFKGKVD